MSEISSLYLSVLIGMRFDLQKKPTTREYRTQIEEYEKELSELSLPKLEAGYQRAEMVKLRFGKPEHALSESELVEKGHFEERLSKLSPSELVRYESASEDETVKNLVEAHRFRALTPELRASYFGQPPDYVHWGALDCWTIDEATSLSMGLDQNVGLLSKVKKPREGFAASRSSSRVEQARHALKVKREDLWKEISVRGFPTDPLLESDEDPEEILREWTFADAADEYTQLQDRIKRAVDAGMLYEKIIPARYVLWARDGGVQIPGELQQAVEARSEIPDWKARYDDLSGQYKAALDERDGLKRELDQLRSTSESKEGRDAILPKERPSVKRLIIGMAVRGYKYNPKAARNEATKDIADDLVALEIPLHADTVRRWLQESADELPPNWDQKNRG